MSGTFITFVILAVLLLIAVSVALLFRRAERAAIGESRAREADDSRSGRRVATGLAALIGFAAERVTKSGGALPAGFSCSPGGGVVIPAASTRTGT